jgi:hypothetical protein
MSTKPRPGRTHRAATPEPAAEPPTVISLDAADPPDAAPPKRPTRTRLQTFFLREFARSGSLADAAARTGVAPRTVQRWRASNTVFAGRYAAVLETRVELLEDAAMRRALGRVNRPVFHRGEHVANVERHNDVMLMRVLERFDRLRERRAADEARRAADADAVDDIRLLEEASERARWFGRHDVARPGAGDSASVENVVVHATGVSDRK